MTETPKSIWLRLRNEANADGHHAVAGLSTNVETGYGMAFFSVGSNGEPRFLVPAAKFPADQFPSMNSNLQIRPSKLTVEGKGGFFIDMLLLEPALEKVFADLCLEVLHRLGEGTEPGLAVIGTVNDFRSLLSAGDAARVEQRIVLGLVGELHVLFRLAQHSPRAIEAWAGPTTQRHDFRSGFKAIEVKSSRRADVARVTINGLEQLEPPQGGSLILAHLQLELAAKGRLSIGSLFSDICALGVDALRLSDLIRAAGCPDPHDPDWNARRWEISSLHLYQVDREFPRLVPASLVKKGLPTGVVAINYEIDLSGVSDRKIPGDVADQLFAGFLS